MICKTCGQDVIPAVKKRCASCGKVFKAGGIRTKAQRRGDAKFCSDNCRLRDWRKQQRREARALLKEMR